jgi:hypothetical protein
LKKKKKKKRKKKKINTLLWHVTPYWAVEFYLPYPLDRGLNGP